VVQVVQELLQQFQEHQSLVLEVAVAVPTLEAQALQEEQAVLAVEQQAQHQEAMP
jgi:hypothetical protein